MAQSVTRETLEPFTKNSKLLALLDDAGIDRLARHGVAMALPASKVVVRQGEMGHTFYLIARGEVRVLVAEAGDKEVARLGAGMFFGEMAVITKQPRSATVETTCDTELICFSRDPVVQILRDYPKVREFLGNVGLSRTEENMDHMLDADDGDSGGLADLLEGGDDDAGDAGYLADGADDDDAGDDESEAEGLVSDESVGIGDPAGDLGFGHTEAAPTPSRGASQSVAPPRVISGPPPARAGDAPRRVAERPGAPTGGALPTSPQAHTGQVPVASAAATDELTDVLADADALLSELSRGAKPLKKPTL